jgi:hypothetical protein
MVKKEEEKETPTKKTVGKTRTKKETAPSFDYKDYIEKTFDKPKAFIYYITVNELSFKTKEEVEKAYELFKQLGGQ